MINDIYSTIILVYLIMAFLTGITAGFVERDSLIDGIAYGLFWPLFIMKRAWQMLRGQS